MWSWQGRPCWSEGQEPGLQLWTEHNPEGPSTQYLRTLVPNTIKRMVFGTRNTNIGYLDPLGKHAAHKLKARWLSSFHTSLALASTASLRASVRPWPLHCFASFFCAHMRSRTMKCGEGNDLIHQPTLKMHILSPCKYALGDRNMIFC